MAPRLKKSDWPTDNDRIKLDTGKSRRRVKTERPASG